MNVKKAFFAHTGIRSRGRIQRLLMPLQQSLLRRVFLVGRGRYIREEFISRLNGEIRDTCLYATGYTVSRSRQREGAITQPPTSPVDHPTADDLSSE